MTMSAGDLSERVRWIRVRVDEERAAARFGTRRFRPPWLKPAALDPRSRHRELVWAPYHLVRSELRGRRQELREMFSLVCALTGYTARWEKALLQQEEAPSSAGLLQAKLSREQALAIATHALNRTLLSLRHRGLRLDHLDVVGLVRYPYWIETFERRRGMLDLRSLDAVTGRPSGSAVRQAILEALVDEHREQEERSSRPCLL